MKPFDRFFLVCEIWCVRAGKKDIALIRAHAKCCYDANIRYLLFGSGDNPRHVADVTDVLFSGQHGIDDNSALQSYREFDSGAFWQIFFIELLVPHDDAGP